jgi:hypothetical protein
MPFSGKNFAILEYFSVLCVHGKVGRTTTRFFGVVVLADKLMETKYNCLLRTVDVIWVEPCLHTTADVRK